MAAATAGCCSRRGSEKIARTIALRHEAFLQLGHNIGRTLRNRTLSSRADIKKLGVEADSIASGLAQLFVVGKSHPP
jgi:hypothetical protein